MSIRLLVVAGIAIALVVFYATFVCEDCSAEARTFLRELVRALR